MAKPIPFTCGQHVVYPAHGIGTIQSVETQEISGHSLEMLVISFEEARMTLRLPVTKVSSSGLRPLCTPKEMKNAIGILSTPSRTKRCMWSRRAQEYEAKINSGNPVFLAQVVRELYKTAKQTEQSYSERQIYQNAMHRLAGEIAAIESIQSEQAIQKVEKILEAA